MILGVKAPELAEPVGWWESKVSRYGDVVSISQNMSWSGD